MKCPIIQLISDSLFCTPEQFVTPGRILITDCYWTRQFPDCAQFFQIGPRFIFVVPFRWAALFQPILEKLRLGSGLDPSAVLELLSDRKRFSELRIESLRDIFINCTTVTDQNRQNRSWWNAYPINYLQWSSLETFEEKIKEDLEESAFFADKSSIWGIDVRNNPDLESVATIFNSSRALHLVFDQANDISVIDFNKDSVISVLRHRICW